MQSLLRTLIACVVLPQVLLLAGCREKEDDAAKDEDADSGSVEFVGCIYVEQWQKDRLSRESADVAVVAYSSTTGEKTASYYVSKENDSCQTKPNGCPSYGKFTGLPFGSYRVAFERHSKEFREGKDLTRRPEIVGWYAAPSGPAKFAHLVRTADSATVIIIDKQHRAHLFGFERF